MRITGGIDPCDEIVDLQRDVVDEEDLARRELRHPAQSVRIARLQDRPTLARLDEARDVAPGRGRVDPATAVLVRVPGVVREGDDVWLASRGWASHDYALCA